MKICTRLPVWSSNVSFCCYEVESNYSSGVCVMKLDFQKIFSDYYLDNPRFGCVGFINYSHIPNSSGGLLMRGLGKIGFSFKRGEGSP